MIRPRALLGTLTMLWGGACTEVRLSETIGFAQDEVVAVDVDIERGAIDVTGREGEGRAVLAAWGWGRNQARADARAVAVPFEHAIVDGALVVRSDDVGIQSGLDVSVLTHPQTDLALTTEQGDIAIQDVEGVWRIAGRRVASNALAGEGDLFASGGASVEIWPYVDGVITLDVTGDTVLALPAFGPYDLLVDGDPAEEMLVQDLGFDAAQQGAGWFEGRREPGTIRIDVRVFGGSFTLIESVR